jgi:hypothetical protein
MGGNSIKKDVGNVFYLVKQGFSGLGQLANDFVEKILSYSVGLRYTALVAIIGVLCLTIIWSLTSKNKFFPKDSSYSEVQSKAILHSLRKEHTTSPVEHLPSFATRKLEYLQRPTFSPSALS